MLNKKRSPSTYPDDLKPYLWEDLVRDLGESREGLKTGFESLDQHIRIPPGAITIIAGRTTEGKTSFLLNLLVNMLRSGDKKFYFFSYDEPIKDIAVKIIMIMAGEILSSARIKNLEGYRTYLKQLNGKKRGRGNNRQIDKAVEDYRRYIFKERLVIFDCHYDNVRLANYISSLTGNELTGAVFLDCIQKINFNEAAKYQQRYVEIKRISESLLEKIKRYEVPLIMAAQANIDNLQFQRGKPAKTSLANKTPIRLDSIRESADIGQDASLVLGLSLGAPKENQSKTAEDGLMLEVTVLKNRNGRSGRTFSLPFNGPVFKIEEPEEPYY